MTRSVENSPGALAAARGQLFDATRRVTPELYELLSDDQVLLVGKAGHLLLKVTPG